MDATFAIDVRYYRLSEPLQPYFTALYGFEFECTSGHIIEDYLHPEWTQMRFTTTPPLGCVGPGELKEQWPFVASGPTSRSIHFGITTGKILGLGLQPAGWAKFAQGSARAIADSTVDGSTHPSFTLFAPIQRMMEEGDPDLDTMAARINDYLMRQADRPLKHESVIFACQEALRDPEIANVSQLGERLGLGARSLERFCSRHFGFPPKLLLRRQRFLRSLAEFMLTSRRSWSAALDAQYYDQAQFVRDFHAFMGMTPSEYAEMPHPILDRIIAQRMADQGAAPQTDLPTLLRYTAGAPRAD
jgi:AraC-like DNA-binding protein